MDAKTIESIKRWIDTLDPEEREGALDAINRIILGRTPPGSPLPPPDKIDIDPDLEKPDDTSSHSPDFDPDTKIEDPEHLLDGKDDDDDLDDPDDSKGDEDDEDKDDKEGKGDKSEDKDKSKDKSDGEGDGESDDDKSDDDNSDDEGDDKSDDENESDKDKDNKKRKPGSGDDDKKDKGDDGDDGYDGSYYDDEDDSLDDKYKETKTEKEERENEIFRRKVELSRISKVIKKALSELSDSPKDKSLKETLEKMQEKVKEMADAIKDNAEKAVKDLSSEEFDDIISSILDTIDKTTTGSTITRKTKAEIDNDIKKISDDFANEFNREELNDEDIDNKSLDPTEIARKKMKAREAEKKRIEDAMKAERYKVITSTLTQFKEDIKKAMTSQIEHAIEVEEATWAKEDRRHADDGIATPGVRIDELPEDKRPTIDVYFDQSGSWGNSEVERGMKALSEILKLDKQKLLKLNIYYFSKILSQDQAAARAEGSQECWDLVLDNIDTAPKTKNVVLITDTDIGYDYGTFGHHGCVNGRSATVDGCVWIIWKNGGRVPAAPMKLKGRRGNFEYLLKD